MDQKTIEQMLYEIKTDLASVKTDVTWLKRLFTITLIGIGLIFGVDLTGAI
ncbi:hypothetical protein KAU33_14265 [Candidatus Dependentiae bacterium]|nr:hypothetical protein [Candidatus Dependentiae bacterium]